MSSQVARLNYMYFSHWNQWKTKMENEKTPLVRRDFQDSMANQEVVEEGVVLNDTRFPKGYHRLADLSDYSNVGPSGVWHL